MVNEEPEPREGGKRSTKKSLRGDVDEILKNVESGDESIGNAVEKLMDKKDEVPVGDLIGLVKNSGIIEDLEDKVKRKYKVK
jgi:hypothetical protein